MILEKLKGLSVYELSVLDIGCGNFNTEHGTELSAIPFKSLTVIDRVPKNIRSWLANKAFVQAGEFEALVRDLNIFLPETLSESYDLVIATYSLGTPPVPDLVEHCERIARKGTVILPEPVEDKPKSRRKKSEPEPEETWEEMEAQADEDIEEGRILEFDSVDDAIDMLNEITEEES